MGMTGMQALNKAVREMTVDKRKNYILDMMRIRHDLDYIPQIVIAAADLLIKEVREDTIKELKKNAELLMNADHNNRAVKLFWSDLMEVWDEEN